MNIMRTVSPQGMNIINEFIASPDNAALNPKTVKEYTGDLRHFIGWHEYKSIDSRTLVIEFVFNQVGEVELSAYKRAMQEVAELKIATVNRRLITLKMFFEWAVERGYLETNPTLNLKLLAPDKILPRQITASEEKMLINAVTGNGSLRDQAIIKVMLNTGLKTGEVCSIQKTDIQITKRLGFLIIKKWGWIAKNPTEFNLPRYFGKISGNLKIRDRLSVPIGEDRGDAGGESFAPYHQKIHEKRRTG